MVANTHYGQALMSSDKVRYVKEQKQTRSHTCHWPGCTAQVPPAMWGCRRHWFQLPMRLRNKIWAAYVPGQEKTLTPSAAYLAAAEEVQQWIKTNRAGTRWARS